MQFNKIFSLIITITLSCSHTLASDTNEDFYKQKELPVGMRRMDAIWLQEDIAPYLVIQRNEGILEIKSLKQPHDSSLKPGEHTYMMDKFFHYLRDFILDDPKQACQVHFIQCAFDRPMLELIGGILLAMPLNKATTSTHFVDCHFLGKNLKTSLQKEAQFKQKSTFENCVEILPLETEKKKSSRSLRGIGLKLKSFR